MSDYKKMYCTLFNEISKAIECLQMAQQKAEELYIDSEDTCAEFVKDDDNKNNPPNHAVLKLTK